MATKAMTAKRKIPRAMVGGAVGSPEDVAEGEEPDGADHPNTVDEDEVAGIDDVPAKERTLELRNSPTVPAGP